MSCKPCEIADSIIKQQTKLLEQSQSVAGEAIAKAAELNVRLQEELMKNARLTAIAVTAAQMVDVNDPEMATELLKAISVTT